MFVFLTFGKIARCFENLLHLLFLCPVVGTSQGGDYWEARIPEEWLEHHGRLSGVYISGRYHDLSHRQQQSQDLWNSPGLPITEDTPTSQVRSIYVP